MVVLLDDNAFRVVGLELIDRKDISVVFCGLNGQPEDYDKKKKFLNSREHPGHNVTGVYEKLHLKRALTVLYNALSNITKVVGITDFSPPAMPSPDSLNLKRKKNCRFSGKSAG